MPQESKSTLPLIQPHKELAKYVAEYRNYYWQKSRTDNQQNFNIRKPLKAKPYPNSKEEASDEAEDDKGNNFGRIARAGFLMITHPKLRRKTI